VRRKCKFDLSLIARVAEIVDRERIEIVQGVLQFAVLIAWLATKWSIKKPPVVAGVHTTINRGLKQELQDRLIYRRILRQLPAIVFVCEYQRDYWINKYPDLQLRAHVVYNGIDPDRFNRDNFTVLARELRADLGVPKSAFVLSCIAAFRPEKGHRLLIEAFAQIAGDAHLILAGDGIERRAIERAVSSRGLIDRVHFVGSIPDVRPLVVASDATVLASTAVETFSMAMLESMALEVPMIAPRIGGLEEAIVEGETGFLFPIGDTMALVAAIRKSTTSPELLRTMGLAAAMKVRSSFTLKNMIDGSEMVLSGAIGSHLGM
jgi:glycosyltransferase involved in cell wall biosynthesis